MRASWELAVEIEAFDEFYLGTRAALLGQLAAMTADTEVATEALQDAYSRAWTRWGRVSRLDDPVSWVRVVAWERSVSAFRRRTIADRFRRIVRRRRPEASRRSGADEALDIQGALRLLPDTHRRTLVLYDLCGLPMDRVADETGVPVETVERRLSRGRASLRSYLERDFRSEETISFGGWWT